MSCASGITLLSIQQKQKQCAELLEAEDYLGAFKKANVALSLIAAKPEQEFDDQRMEWRNAKEAFELLLKTTERLLQLQQNATSEAGGLRRIAVRRACPEPVQGNPGFS